MIKSRVEVIEMWARSEACSERRRLDGIKDAASLPLAELVQKLHQEQSSNINRLANETYSLHQIARDRVIELALVPMLATLGSLFETALEDHPLLRAKHYEGPTETFEAGIVGFEGRALPYRPPERTWILVDGTFRTLVRLKNGETTIPLWVPESFASQG